MRALVPNNLGFEVEVAGVDVESFAPMHKLGLSRRDADALVVFESPPELLRSYAHALPNVRFVQTLAAGTESVTAAGFDPATVIASGRGLHDRPVAEHALALLLAAARSLPVAFRAQAGRRWASELGGRRPFPDPERFTTLVGARVAILGFGSIGHTLARHLTALSATPVGITRDGLEPGTVALHDAPELLPSIDALVLALPAAPGNRKIVDAALLSRMPRHAWIINVGRGITVDEAALTRSLERGDLGGAALDVFESEPLPSSSPLWSLPNVIITPHAAGGRPDGAKELIESNLALFRDGRQPRNLVPHPLPDFPG